MQDLTRKCWDPRIELMSRGELRILQERRLRQVVEFAYARSPFYRAKFDRAGLKPRHIRSLSDLNKIPTTDKYEMRASSEASVAAGKRPFAEFLTAPEELVVTVHCTSGTTGTPFTAPLLEPEITARGMIATGESAARQFWAAGLRPGDVLAHMWNLGGAMVGGGNHVIAKGACIPELFMAVIPCHVGNTAQILATLKELEATAICCTPSYALHLPEVAQKIGIDPRKDLKIKVIVTGGEPGGASVPGLRERLRQLWGAEIFDMYGAPGVGLNYECEAHAGFHTHADGGIIQVVHPETKEELPMGEVGSLVGTGLGMAAFPWLRFDTEDQGALTEEPCPCGRTHPRILSVPGRWDDMIKVKGFQLHPNSIEKVLGETPGCTGDFLILLEKDEAAKDRVRIQVEHDPGLEDLDAFQKALEERIRLTITLRAHVEVVPKGTLARYVMKRQRVLDNRSQDARARFDEAAKARSAKYFG
ncbi:MAG: AMP-binding protein [Deltaproteobacteria bacterium]|nr:AMP-binding protein [Deltaproteobacteria bacterium]